MLRRSLLLASLLLSACASPPSNGGLWAQQGIEQELQVYRLSDAERTAAARAFELQIADELLAAEQARLTASFGSCPGAPANALVASEGIATRDAIRIRAANDAERLTRVAQLALADWRLRRARATGDQSFCGQAAAALTDTPQRLPEQTERKSTVAHDPTLPGVALEDDGQRERTLTSYALGLVDSVRAAGPLPRHLSIAYGGAVLDPAPAASPEEAQIVVDAVAGGLPQYEPDALYAWLSGQP